MERFRALLAIAGTAAAGLALGQGGPPPGRPPGMHPLIEAAVKASSSLRFAGVREVTFPQQGGGVSRFREKVLQDGRRRRIEYAAGGPFGGHISVDDGQIWLQYNPEKNEIRERPTMGGDPWMMFLRGGPRRGGERRPEGGPRGEGVGSRPPGEPRRGGTRGGPWQPPRVEREASQKVAGLDSTVLAFKGAQDKVYARLWIEPNRKMVLKSQAYGPDGKVFGGFEFVAIKFDPKIPAQAFTLNITGAKRVTSQDEAASAFKSLKMPVMGLAPDTGWRLTNVRKMDTENVKFVSLSYSSSENRVTLFVMSGKPDGEKLKQMAGGRANIFTWKKSGLNFVLMGRMEDSALKELSQKVSQLNSRPGHP